MIALVGQRFELLRKVGQGSYGVVYEARDRYTSGTVALKLLHGSDALSGDRFDLEAAVLAELTHPAIVRYVAHGLQEDGRRYLAMEWLVGRTLEQHMARRMSVDDVVSIARRVVAGLAFASLRGVTHRDIKPANLFLVDGEPGGTKVLDFGLARRTSDRQRLTATGMIVGTPLYMSPEQARGDTSLDNRTDVFSLGTVLYTCLSGMEPFDAAQVLATLAKICFDEPVPLSRLAPHVPARLAALVQSMMRKNRDERPTLRAMADELSAIAEELSAAGPRSAEERFFDGASKSQTMELPLDGGSMAMGAASLRRRSQAADPRIRVALFMAIESEPTAELAAELNRVTTRFGMEAERMLDGSCIVLPSTALAAGEQALTAARCALALRPLLGAQARAVVCTGRATVDSVQRSGELFERGALMLASAPSGVVQVDAPSAAMLAGRFELTADGHTGTTLDRERSGGDVPRTLLGRLTTFVGRERELQQLQLIFAECIDELVARPVLITAPAGGGKSRLRHELLERLSTSGARFTLVLGRGDAMRGGAQFGVLASAIQAWAELASSDGPDVRRSKLAARVAALVPGAQAAFVAAFLGEMIGVPFPDHTSPQLRAARVDHQLMADHMLESWLAWLEALSRSTPVLFCIEDLHWSDPASVRFIEAALRNTRDRALMVLALARPEVHESFPKIWAERDLTEIRLAKLSPRACARMLEAFSAAPAGEALRAAMIERADGNPFFLEELVRALHESPQADALPETILAIVQVRLDALGEEPKLLVRAASVFGQSFRLPGVRVLLGEGDTGLDVEGSLALLCEREIIVRSGPASDQEYVFRHGLIRDAAYLLLHDEDRELGHRLAATWLERIGEAPALLADHYERGADPARAAHWWARAAAQAFDAGSLDDVLRCGERAIQCGIADQQLGELAALLADARSYAQDDTGAAAWAKRALANLPVGEPAWWRATRVGAVTSLRLGAPELELLVARTLANYRADLAMPEQALAVAYLVSECTRFARDDLVDTLFALLPSELPEALRGRPEGCLEVARAIKAFTAGRLGEALRFAECGLVALRAAGAMRDVCETLALCGWFLHWLGAYQEAEARLLEMVVIAKRIGSARDVCYGQLYLGSIYARTGRAEEAERALCESIAAYVHLAQPSFHAEALGHLAGLQHARGALDAACTSVAQGLALDPIEPAARAYLLARAASASLASGRRDVALGEARAAHALVLEHGAAEYAVVVELCLAEALIALGDARAAQQVLTDALSALELRAADIDDSALRRSFLEQVAEHARLRELAAVHRAA